MFGLVLLPASFSTCDVVTMNFEANIHPPFTTLPHPVGPSTSSPNTSTSQKPFMALYQTARHHIPAESKLYLYFIARSCQQLKLQSMDEQTTVSLQARSGLHHLLPWPRAILRALTVRLLVHLLKAVSVSLE